MKRIFIHIFCLHAALISCITAAFAQQVDSVRYDQNRSYGGGEPGVKPEHVLGINFGLSPEIDSLQFNNSLKELKKYKNARSIRLGGAFSEGGIRGDSIPAPITLLPHIETLELDDCHLKKLPAHPGNWRNIKTLIINEYKLSQQLPENIGLLDSLETLYVNIPDADSSIYPEEIYKLKKLEYLKIYTDANGKVRLPPVKLLRKIKYLNIASAYDGVIILPEIIGTLQHLEGLRVYYGHGESVISQEKKTHYLNRTIEIAAHCPGLKYLDVDVGYRIYEVPPLAKLTNLRSVTLKLDVHNYMGMNNEDPGITAKELWTGVIQQLSELKQLKTLDLSETSYYEAIPALAALVQIDTLILEKGYYGFSPYLAEYSPLLEDLFSSLSKTNLKFLSLKGLSIMQIPANIGNVSTLEGLDLSGNHLTSLPPSIGMLQHLNYLDLSLQSYYDFVHLPPSFYNLKELRYLDIHGTTKLAENEGNKIRKSFPKAEVILYFKQSFDREMKAK